MTDWARASILSMVEERDGMYEVIIHGYRVASYTPEFIHHPETWMVGPKIEKDIRDSGITKDWLEWRKKHKEIQAIRSFLNWKGDPDQPPFIAEDNEVPSIAEMNNWREKIEEDIFDFYGWSPSLIRGVQDWYDRCQARYRELRGPVPWDEKPGTVGS